VIRSIVTYLFVLLVTPPLSLAVILGSFFGMPRWVHDGIPRMWCRWIIAVAGIPIRTEGLEHLPRDRAIVVASNHESWIDVGVLAVLIPQRYRFVGKKELQRVPIWGRAWVAAGHISVDREDTQSAVRSLQQASELVRADNSAVVIFPEGTRTKTGELMPFKKGAFRLAAGLGVDIVPVGISGSREMLPRGGWRIRKGRITVRFGEPIPTQGYGPERTDELMARVRAAIERLRDAPAPAKSEENAGNHEHSRT
jgi:1-acyl-sn-glycerol-3-phosphate acyltransferase